MLRHKRLAAGLTQDELARKAGVSRLVIGKNERGERRIDVIELQALCRALGISTAAFMSELEERQKRWQLRVAG